MLRRFVLRIAAIVSVLMLTVAAPVANAGKLQLQQITLKGKFVVPDPADDTGFYYFKAGGKKHLISLESVELQKHSVKKLKEIKPGTEMLLFAKFTPWADGDEFERMACLLSGPHHAPPHTPKGPSLPTWYKGSLSFNSNNTIAYVDGASLPTGVDRVTCVIEKATVGDFFDTKKNGKKKAKTAYIRGTYMKIESKGKSSKVFVPSVITLPTRGLPSKEYKYILDPSKMYKDLSG